MTGNSWFLTQAEQEPILYLFIKIAEGDEGSLPVGFVVKIWP